MRLEKPEVLVQVAGNCREKIHRDVVTEIAGLLNRGTQRIRVMRDVMHQPLQLRRAIGGSEIGFLQAASRGDFAGCSVGDAAESRDPLGDGVALVVYMRRNGIKELVELNEMHALDVPVRPLDLAAKVDTVGQARVEKRDQSLAMLFRYTDIAFISASR